MNSESEFHHSRIWALCTFKWWRHLIFPKKIIDLELVIRESTDSSVSERLKSPNLDYSE